MRHIPDFHAGWTKLKGDEDFHIRRHQNSVGKAGIANGQIGGVEARVQLASRP